MSQYFSLHPVNPQLRLILRTGDILHAGGVGEAADLCGHRAHPAERPAMGLRQCRKRAAGCRLGPRAKQDAEREGGAGRRTRDGS